MERHRTELLIEHEIDVGLINCWQNRAWTLRPILLLRRGCKTEYDVNPTVRPVSKHSC